MADSENTNEVENNEVENNEVVADKMNIEVEITETSTCERHVKVTVSQEDVERYFNKECDEIRSTVSLPGFRVGKAPRRMVEKRCREDILARMKSNLLLDSLDQINNTEKLTPISEPDLDFKSIKVPESGPFVYEYNIEVRPEFDVPNWKGLHLEKPVREFSDEDIDQAIARICMNNAKLVSSDEPAKLDDYIQCSLRFVDADGTEVVKSQKERIQIRRSLTFRDGTINDFDKLMTGAKPGDTIETSMVVSIDTPNGFLSGQTLTAIFDIEDVLVPDVPKADAGFIYQLGGFTNMADFRDYIRDMLVRQMEHNQTQTMRQQITTNLTATANWNLPPGLLERQSRREIQRAVMEMRRNKFTEEQVNSQINFLYQNIKKTTSQALKEHFIFERIAEIEGITDEAIDYEVEIAFIAAQMGESPRRVRAAIEKNGEMDILRNQIIERKVLQVITDEAQIEEVSYVPEFLEAKETVMDIAASGEEQGDDIPTVSEEEAKEEAKEIAREDYVRKNDSKEKDEE